MIRLSFSLPIVHTTPAPLAHSPCCRSGLIRHQSKSRGLTDIRLGAVTVQRYLCKACGRTFTHRPRGVSRSSKSDRVKATAVLAYCLGLSYDASSQLLGALGAPLCKSSVYNYVRAAGQAARRLHRRSRSAAPLALGQDTTRRPAGQRAKEHPLLPHRCPQGQDRLFDLPPPRRRPNTEALPAEGYGPPDQNPRQRRRQGLPGSGRGGGPRASTLHRPPEESPHPPGRPHPQRHPQGPSLLPHHPKGLSLAAQDPGPGQEGDHPTLAFDRLRPPRAGRGVEVGPPEAARLSGSPAGPARGSGPAPNTARRPAG